MKGTFLAALFCAGCSVPSSTMKVLPFEFPEGRHTFLEPVVLNTIEFNVELATPEAVNTVQVLPQGAIMVRGKPLIRRVRRGIFEVAGEPRFFRDGSKVFVLEPRPGGKLVLSYGSITLLLEGSERKPFVVSLYGLEEGEELEYGRARLRFVKGRVYGEDGAPLAPDAVARGLRLTKKGVTGPL